MAIACGALAACGVEEVEEPAASGPPPPPRGSVAGVDFYSDVGGVVRDLALLPAEGEPWRGRGVALVSTGGFVTINPSEGGLARHEGPRAASLAAAPRFSMRGVAAPLVLTAGEATEQGRAYLYLGDEDGFTPAPLEPLLAGETVLGLCGMRATDAVLEIVAVTASAGQSLRVLDRGEEALAAEPTDRGSPDAEACVARVQAEAAGLTLSGADGQVTDTAATTLEGQNVYLAAAPERGALLVTLGDAGAPEVELTIESGLNAAAADRPFRVAASGANFGGSFGGGVVLVAQDDQITVLALDDVVAATRAALHASTSERSNEPT